MILCVVDLSCNILAGTNRFLNGFNVHKRERMHDVRVRQFYSLLIKPTAASVRHHRHFDTGFIFYILYFVYSSVFSCIALPFKKQVIFCFWALNSITNIRQQLTTAHADTSKYIYLRHIRIVLL